jgi:predicted Zn-dependent peptidase
LQGPTANVGIYINSGAIYEDASTSGCSALLECLAFKATKHRDTLRVMKEVGSRQSLSIIILSGCNMMGISMWW